MLTNHFAILYKYLAWLLRASHVAATFQETVQRRIPGFRQLRAIGDNVIATRGDAEAKLAHLKDTGAKILDLDVTAPEKLIAEKIEEAWGLFSGIDVVANNLMWDKKGCKG